MFFYFKLPRYDLGCLFPIDYGLNDTFSENIIYSYLL